MTSPSKRPAGTRARRLRETAIKSAFLVTILIAPALSAHAACAPDQIPPDGDGVPQDPASDDVVGIVASGTTVNCDGLEEQPVVTLFSATPPSSVSVNNNGTLSGPIAPVFLEGLGHTVNNLGSIIGNDLIAGTAIIGAGATINNDGNVVATRAIGLLIEGSNGQIVNGASGLIDVSFGEPEGAFIEGADATITNNGQVKLTGDGSEALGIEGDDGTITNTGNVEVSGNEASGLGIEGSNGIIENSGTIAVDGSIAAGIAVGGDGVTITNTGAGSIRMTADSSVGIGVLGSGATVTNEHEIETTGSTAIGLGVLGTGATIENAAGATIATDGEESHGIVLGLREVTVPIGLAVPAGALDPAQGEVTNRGDVTTAGDGSDAIHVFANDGIVTNEGNLTAAGNGASGIGVAGQTIQVSNSGEIFAGITGSVNAAGIRLNETTDTAVDNSGTIDVEGQSSGITGNGLIGAAVGNTGTIRADGSDAFGIDLTGQDISIDNGSDAAPGTVTAEGARVTGVRAQGENIEFRNHFNLLTGEQSTISVSGFDSTAVRLTGTNLFASNEGSIEIGAGASAGLVVEAAGSGAYAAENGGTIRVGDASAPGAGMVLRNISGDTIAVTDDIGASVCGGSPTGAGLLNCGGIALERDASTAMRANGISGSFIENFGTITGNGTDLTGMMALSEGAAANDNFVMNFRDIELVGVGANGIVVAGDGNTIANGTGSIVIFPDEMLPGDPFTAISAQIDIIASVDGVEVEDLPIGQIHVTGPDAVGIDVVGDGNTIAILDSLASPNLVRAAGVGSVGIRLSGENNTVVNSGVVAGESASIEGGSGSDTVINRVALEGDVRLGAGDDLFRIETGGGGGLIDDITVSGDVDGGSGIDVFVVRARDSAEPGEPPVVLRVDGDQYVDFETFSKDGAGIMELSGTLSLGPTEPSFALIEDGVLRLDGGTLGADLINIGASTPDGSATVTGSGTLSGTVAGPGAVEDTVVIVEETGVFDTGESPGRIDILGDLESTGIFRFEIGGLDDSLFDIVNVTGDASFFGGAFEFSFIDGFLPTLGDTFDFLRVSGSVTGLDLVSTSFAGAPGHFEFGLDSFGSGLELVTMSTTAPPTDVPEPGTLPLLGMGALVLLWARRVRARRARGLA